jgi:hypothetical protein
MQVMSRPRVAGGLILLIGALVISAFGRGGSARADTEPPTVVGGSVSGSGRRGGSIEFRLSGRGSAEIASMRITMVLHDLVLQQITYLPNPDRIGLRGGLLLQAGSGETATGSFLRISGHGVRASSAPGVRTVVVRAEVVHALPRGSEFILSATDPAGGTASIVRAAPAVPGPAPSGGLSIGDLVLAVAAALFGGAFVGNLFAARRGQAGRIDVYRLLERRMAEQRPPADAA